MSFLEDVTESSSLDPKVKFINPKKKNKKKNTDAVVLAIEWVIKSVTGFYECIKIKHFRSISEMFYNYT